MTGRTSEETSLSLVCEENFGSGTLTDRMQVRPSRMSSPGQRDLLLFGDAAVVRIGVDGAGQRRAEAGQMGAAVALRDVVGKAEHRLVIAVGPLHRDLEQDALALAADRDRRRVQGLLRAVEIADKGFEPALEMQGDGLRLDPAQIAQDQGDAAVQKGELAQPVLEGREIELGLGEGLGARQKGDLGAGGLPLAAAIPPARPGPGRPRRAAPPARRRGTA